MRCWFAWPHRLEEYSAYFSPCTLQEDPPAAGFASGSSSANGAPASKAIDRRPTDRCASAVPTLQRGVSRLDPTDGSTAMQICTSRHEVTTGPVPHDGGSSEGANGTVVQGVHSSSSAAGGGSPSTHAPRGASAVALVDTGSGDLVAGSKGTRSASSATGRQNAAPQAGIAGAAVEVQSRLSRASLPDASYVDAAAKLVATGDKQRGDVFAELLPLACSLPSSPRPQPRELYATSATADSNVGGEAADGFQVAEMPSESSSAAASSVQAAAVEAAVQQLLEAAVRGSGATDAADSEHSSSASPSVAAAVDDALQQLCADAADSSARSHSSSGRSGCHCATGAARSDVIPRDLASDAQRVSIADASALSLSHHAAAQQVHCPDAQPGAADPPQQHATESSNAQQDPFAELVSLSLSMSNTPSPTSNRESKASPTRFSATVDAAQAHELQAFLSSAQSSPHARSLPDAPVDKGEPPAATPPTPPMPDGSTQQMSRQYDATAQAPDVHSENSLAELWALLEHRAQAAGNMQHLGDDDPSEAPVDTLPSPLRAEGAQAGRAWLHGTAQEALARLSPQLAVHGPHNHSNSGNSAHEDGNPACIDAIAAVAAAEDTAESAPQSLATSAAYTTPSKSSSAGSHGEGIDALLADSSPSPDAAAGSAPGKPLGPHLAGAATVSAQPDAIGGIPFDLAGPVAEGARYSDAGSDGSCSSMGAADWPQEQLGGEVEAAGPIFCAEPSTAVCTSAESHPDAQSVRQYNLAGAHCAPVAAAGVSGGDSDMLLTELAELILGAFEEDEELAQALQQQHQVQQQHQQQQQPPDMQQAQAQHEHSAAPPSHAHAGVPAAAPAHAHVSRQGASIHALGGDAHGSSAPMQAVGDAHMCMEPELASAAPAPAGASGLAGTDAQLRLCSCVCRTCGGFRSTSHRMSNRHGVPIDSESHGNENTAHHVDEPGNVADVQHLFGQPTGKQFVHVADLAWDAASGSDDIAIVSGPGQALSANGNVDWRAADPMDKSTGMRWAMRSTSGGSTAGQHACCGTGDAALGSTAVHDQLARAQRQQQSSDIVLPEALAWRLGIHDDVENCHGARIRVQRPSGSSRLQQRRNRQQHSSLVSAAQAAHTSSFGNAQRQRSTKLAALKAAIQQRHRRASQVRNLCCHCLASTCPWAMPTCLSSEMTANATSLHVDAGCTSQVQVAWKNGHTLHQCCGCRSAERPFKLQSNLK